MKRRICSRSTRSSSGSVKPGNTVMGRDDTIAAMSDEVLTTVADAVATVTLNRPAQRNAMNGAMLTGLRAAFDDLETRGDVRVVIVRGAGPAFCAGMDLKEMEARGGARDPEGDVVAVLQRVERSRHPTIAVVHGDAIAGGCELALHCDLRVMADTARIGMPLARIGMIVPFPLGQKLLEIIGPAQTRHLLFTGRPVDGRRAYEIGMVHQVVAAAEVEAAAAALARTIADNAPLALAGMKQVILRAVAARPAVAHDDLDAAALRARQSADAGEGRRAMLEKRKPRFRGE
ncbi:MAG: enoyl-CoA hydratase/isomerase family protein [Candidatus Rokuibacteriota bacterium]|nr:MAG: enoyl-CoA hydratase/isomerase family protein [Candidatus Rokubacteria bacterium]